MSGATFGRKGSAGDAAADLAARRAAFLAAERARPGSSNRDADEIFQATRPLNLPEKTTGMAYLLWFFLGGFGAHRFYLGYAASGTVQAILGPFCWVMLLTGALWAIFPLIGAGLWILADAFVIPSLVRDANRRIRQRSVGTVFA